MATTTYTIGKASQVSEKAPLLVSVRGKKLGIYRIRDEFVAYENVCPHQGGPACEGDLTQRVIAQARKGLVQEQLDKEKFNIACPWHGILYDMKTGVCLADPTMALKKVEVWLDDEEIKVRL